MKGKRVFAVHYNGKVYSIYKQENEKVGGLFGYYTYVGRRRFDVVPWNHFSNAVGSILDEIEDFDKGEYQEVWL